MYPAGGRKVFYLRKEHNTMDTMVMIFEMIGKILEGAHASEASQAVIAALKKFFVAIAS